MKILFDINHPADVHLFKNLWNHLKADGHDFRIVARDKECTYELLEAGKFPYTKRKGYAGLKKILGLPIINWKIYRIAKEFKPDLLIGGPGDCYITQVGWFLGIPGIIFDDTEFSSLQNKVTFPFAKQIITPQCFWLDLGKKHIRVDSYKELAYLHPDVFNPSKAVVRKAGIDPDKPFILLRLVSWQATHDVGKNEMSKLDELIPKLEKFGKVYISSERPLKDESRRIQLPAQDMHHVLAFARLLVGESATMASECAVLGTPAIYISNSQRGYTQEQQEKYDLVHYFTDEDEAIKDAITLLKRKNLRAEWQKKKNKMLADKVALTTWLKDYITQWK